MYGVYLFFSGIYPVGICVKPCQQVCILLQILIAIDIDLITILDLCFRSPYPYVIQCIGDICIAIPELVDPAALCGRMVCVAVFTGGLILSM